MLLRERYEAREHQWLAAYALKSSESRGRVYPEEKDRYRPAYLRDRDRVIHCAAFRRLEHKTQVFFDPQQDYFRTRLTHSLEVAQVARSVAYSLQLNEGFVEVLSLAHDLGHPPFGHAGQEILDRLMKAHGGFEHNRQGLRTVDLLEKRYPEFDGLNLTLELRESILKHGPSPAKEAFESFPSYAQPFLETQVVDLADRVAYTHHDLDDGLKSGILTEQGLEETVLWKRLSDRVKGRFPDCSERIRRLQIINGIIKTIITDMTEYSFQCLEKENPGNGWEAREAGQRLVCLSPEMEAQCAALNRYLAIHFYQHNRVVHRVDRSEQVLCDLFRIYCERPERLPREFLSRVEKSGLERTVCDYIAGMTDRFAEEEWQRFVSEGNPGRMDP